MLRVLLYLCIKNEIMAPFHVATVTLTVKRELPKPYLFTKNEIMVLHAWPGSTSCGHTTERSYQNNIITFVHNYLTSCGRITQSKHAISCMHGPVKFLILVMHSKVEVTRLMLVVLVHWRLWRHWWNPKAIIMTALMSMETKSKQRI